MQYKLLGNKRLKVSKLHLETMTSGGPGMWTAIRVLHQKQVSVVVKQAIDTSINFINPPNMYREGLSEQLCGQTIKDLGLSIKIWF